MVPFVFVAMVGGMDVERSRMGVVGSEEWVGMRLKLIAKNSIG